MIRSTGIATASIVIIGVCAVCKGTVPVSGSVAEPTRTDAIFMPAWSATAATHAASISPVIGQTELFDFLTVPSARISKRKYARASQQPGSRIFITRFALQPFELDPNSPPQAIDDIIFSSNVKKVDAEIAGVDSDYSAIRLLDSEFLTNELFENKHHPQYELN